MLQASLMDKLRQLRFNGMVTALEEQSQQTAAQELSFEERLSFLLDREIQNRKNRQLAIRLRQAQLKQAACMEEIDYSHSRSLNKSVWFKLADCQWLEQHYNVLLTGPTGTGKTFLSCALAHKACLQGHSARYWKLSRLLDEFTLAKGDGRYMKVMKSLAKTHLLILDDWGLVGLTAEQRHDLLELLDDRHERASTLITSQLPVSLWHKYLDDPTLADAILDRLVHNAHKIELKGESMRKTKASNPQNKQDKQ